MRRGSNHSDQTKALMSATRKGRTFTADHIAKLSTALMGRTQSPQHRAKRLAAVAAANAVRRAERPLN